MAASHLAPDMLATIFLGAASNPEKLCLLSGVCRDWLVLITGRTDETYSLWEAMEQRWWQPLLQQDLCSKDRYGYDRYGKLELGIPLDRFGGFSKSRQELCYRPH